MEHKATIFLCGDVMTGRGIDQIMAHPGNPVLYESFVKDAGVYLDLASQRNGAIPRPVSPDYIWGEALEYMKGADCRIINLETSITAKGEPARKRVHYRMHPKNISCLTVADINCCVLANNHVLDWGPKGLIETLESLEHAALPYTGAGRTNIHAALPHNIGIGEKGNVHVFSWGHTSSGIPSNWEATRTRAGINFLRDFSDKTISSISEHIGKFRKKGDLVVASIHWGSNWGYMIPEAHRKFAHGLIEQAGVDLVHGHSSHHFLGIEVYKNRLILYGCGDFLNDYEGIRNHRGYKGHLGFIYLPTYNLGTGELLNLRLIPTQIKKFRVVIASKKDRLWMENVLNREGKALGTFVEAKDAISFQLSWA